MAEDRHHFVPQFLMKRFAIAGSERAVRLLRTNSNRIVATASIRDQCQRRGFYLDPGMEAALRDFEGRWSTVTARICATNSLPQERSEDHALLLYFASVQLLRTPGGAAHSDAMLDRVGKKFLATKFSEAGVDANDFQITDPASPFRGLKLAMKAAPFLDDLRMRLVVDPAGRFVLGDNPVLRMNPYAGHSSVFGTVSFTSRGLIILVPISPSHYVALSDRSVYRFGQPGRDRSSPLAQDVNALNGAQYAQATDTLILPPTLESAHLDAAIKLGAEHRGRPSVRIVEIPAPTGGTYLLASHQPSSVCRSLSFVSVRREARKFAREARAFAPRRDPKLPTGWLPALPEHLLEVTRSLPSRDGRS